MEPLLLGSVVLDDNGALVVDLANADLHDAEGKVWLQRDSIYRRADQVPARQRLLRADPGAALQSGSRRPIPLEIAFDADFADLFEVRGERRARRGTLEVARLDGRSVRFAYLGLDGIERTHH